MGASVLPRFFLDFSRPARRPPKNHRFFSPSLGRTLRREKWPRAVKKTEGRPKVWKKLYKPPCEKTWFIAKIIMQQQIIYFLGLFSPKNDKSVVHENTNSGASPCPFSAQLGGDPPEGVPVHEKTGLALVLLKIEFNGISFPCWQQGQLDNMRQFNGNVIRYLPLQFTFF